VPLPVDLIDDATLDRLDGESFRLFIKLVLICAMFKNGGEIELTELKLSAFTGLDKFQLSQLLKTLLKNSLITLRDKPKTTKEFLNEVDKEMQVSGTDR
jgi:hypothetical protein